MTSLTPGPEGAARGPDPRERATGERTGHPVVDAVLDTISGGADRPLAERADTLAAAHEQLHAVLDEHRRPGATGS